MAAPTYIYGLLQVKAYRVLQQHVSATLAKFGIIPSEWFVIGAIYKKRHLQPADLAKELQVERPYITKITDGLVKKKLIQKIPAKKDKRQRTLTLTEKGRQLAQDAERHLSLSLRKLLAGTNNKQLETYKNVLETIVVNDIVN